MASSSLLQDLFNIIDTYIASSKSTQTPVHSFVLPESLREKLNLKLPETGQQDQILETIKEYLDYSVKTGNPQFFNQLWAGFTLPAFIGETIAALANTSMYTYEMAPVATLMEQELVDTMKSYIGYDHGEGMMVTGGSNANLVALLAARNEHNATIKDKGLRHSGERQLVMFCSDQAHYSFLKAANILGLGMESVIKVSSDSDGKILPKELEKAITVAQNNRQEPFFVAATAGTTVLGAFDPIKELAEIAHKNTLWFHIDGSFGGSALLSKKHKHLLDGCHMADSFAWNAHKMMGVPLICSLLFFREKGTFLKHCSSHSGDYIFHDNDHSSLDTGPQSLQCGRRVDALKLYLTWQYFGSEGLEKRMNHLFDMAAYAEQKVQENDHFELVAPRQSCTVCFRYLPHNRTDIDQCNVHIRETLIQSGKSMVNQAVVDNKRVIRLVTLNADITTDDIDQFFDNVLQAAITCDQ